MRRVFARLVVAAVALQGVSATAGAERAATAADPARPTYLIGAGDALQVFVWKEPDLTRDVTVRPDGWITIPLLGEIQAVGRAPAQLAEEIATGLKRYLAAPQVTLALRTSNNGQFFVVGHVQRSGAFPLAARMTFLQALALAGGLQDYAKSDRILIVRQERGTEQFKVVNYKKLEEGTDITQNVVIMPGDTIVVP